MKRIACASCGAKAEFQHETRPSFFLCFVCARDMIQFMHVHHVISGNPFAAEIIKGIGESVPGNRIRVWTRSKYEDTAWSETFFTFDESGRVNEYNPFVDNLLDNIG